MPTQHAQGDNLSVTPEFAAVQKFGFLVQY